jgi:hypothetical protein
VELYRRNNDPVALLFCEQISKCDLNVFNPTRFISDCVISSLATKSDGGKHTQDILISNGVRRMLDVILKRFEEPDETRLFEKRKFNMRNNNQRDHN